MVLAPRMHALDPEPAGGRGLDRAATIGELPLSTPGIWSIWSERGFTYRGLRHGGVHLGQMEPLTTFGLNSKFWLTPAPEAVVTSPKRAAVGMGIGWLFDRGNHFGLYAFRVGDIRRQPCGSGGSVDERAGGAFLDLAVIAGRVGVLPKRAVAMWGF
jgi:hypothetical protein